MDERTETELQAYPLDLVTFIPAMPASVHASLAMALGYSERFCGGKLKTKILFSIMR